MWLYLVTSLAIVCLLHANGNFEKIVGGRNATIEEFPWQVSLLNASNGKHFCGGSVIDRFTILTAAHCIRPNRPVRIRLGSTYHATGGSIRDVQRITIHPDYVRSTDENDIALVILKYPLFFNNRIQPIALPEFDYDLSATSLIVVSGWGVRGIKNERGYAASLQSVVVPIVAQNDCVEAYHGFSRNVTNYMLCAGLLGEGGKDSCTGDSGGPAVYFHNNQAVIHGIVSWGYGCALPTHPGVYTRVSRYLQWIDANK